MAEKFVTAHTVAKKAETRVNDIFAIKQSPGEGLGNFLARFNGVRMTLPNVSEGIVVAACQNGLSREGSRETIKLLSRLMKYPPATYDEIHNAYYVEVRENDDDLNEPTRRLISVQSKPRNEPGKTQKETIQYRGQAGNDINHMSGGALEKLGTKVKCPPKMRLDPSTRKSDTLCEFHQERGHKAKDSQALRLSVANLVQQEHLKQLLSDKGRNTLAMGRECPGPPKLPSPIHTINMIIGGSDDVSINGIKFTATHKLKRSITHERYDELEESIIFDESDADSLTFPHNDALVITLRILDTDIRRIMVDEKSGACIIHPRVLAHIRLEDKIVSRCITLTDFNNAVEWTSGDITLPVLAGGVTLETTFHIMD
ncbi:uncharacterized protein [Nicotiana tomentosiformis]|uniref:uncharacterized protein n=1 Tax=Nicotiana tomentosiformis TaxID=4098 RepID=UPI00051C6C18|nr:uncharacterized protein LOC104116767 [Nicotiana tomentosiformis]